MDNNTSQDKKLSEEKRERLHNRYKQYWAKEVRKKKAMNILCPEYTKN